MRTILQVIAVAACVIACERAFADAPGVAPSAATSKSAFASINGRKLYFERYGQGRPLVLLHGGAGTIGHSFEKQLQFFSAHREVIAIEQVGHGHSPDADVPFTYELMAEDTASLLRSLKVERADLVGWSDGGILALIVARRHPDLVNRVVASGANARLVGMTPAEIAEIRASTPEQLGDKLGAEHKANYIATSPDGPQHWPKFAKKIWDLWLTPVILENADLGAIKAPCLIVSGDKDDIPVEHALEIFKALPNAQLLVLPGTGHHTFKSAASIINQLVLTFLDAR